MTTTNARRAADRARAAVVEPSVRAGKRAGTDARRASSALVRAVSDLVNKAVDQVLLGDERVGSASEARQLLNRDEQVEALAGEIQRVVVLAVPVLRRLARGARLTRVPWVFVASTTLSIGIAVRRGVKEIQALSSLVAYRLEQAAGSPADPALVKKLAIDLGACFVTLEIIVDRRVRLKEDLLRGTAWLSGQAVLSTGTFYYAQ